MDVDKVEILTNLYRAREEELISNNIDISLDNFKNNV